MGITTKDTIESMSYIMFSGTNIITYNDKISIQFPYKTDFHLFVKAMDIYKFMSKLKDEFVILEKKEDKLNISCKSIRARLSTIFDEDAEERIAKVSKSLKKAIWKDLPDNFTTKASLCSFTASKNESDHTLTCIYINGKDIISSDNNRVAHAKLSEKMDEMFIKASEIKNLTSINPIEYAITKSWLHFRGLEGCVFSIRRVDGTFPDYLQFFNFTGTTINLPKEILTGIDITSILMENIDSAITFKISNGFCHISVQSDSGAAKYRSKIDYNGKEIKFTANPDFLKEMMNHSSSIIFSKDKAKLNTDDGDFSLLMSLF